MRHSAEERYIDVIWDEDFDGKAYESSVNILSYDRKNIVAEIINTLNSTSVTITSISSSKNKDGDLLTKVKLLVKNLDTLNNAIVNLYKISDIYDIERVIK